MQTVTMDYRGEIYDLGIIIPLQTGGKTQYMIVPTFEFRPPFLCLRLLHCHRRMEMIAVEKLKDGHNIPKLKRSGASNFTMLSTLHEIKVR